MSELMMKPGVSLGNYPQRPEQALDDLEAVIRHWGGRLRRRLGHKRSSPRAIGRKVNRHDAQLRGCSDAYFDDLIQELRWKLYHRGLQEKLVIDSFAVIREAAARTLGKRHYDVQLYGGWLMINGMLAEMQTGEGKTLTTTLPSCSAALSGIPVHIITANDYLAQRDCETLAPLYRRLGLSASWVIDGMTPQQCQKAYQADIVHTTNKQIAFDYLRDRIEMGEDTGDLRLQYRQIRNQLEPGPCSKLMLRGLCFAIVDEADSVLIDEANTPLIITRTIPNEDSAETYSDALYLASSLLVGEDYRSDEKHRSIDLTVSGEDNLELRISNLPKLWLNKRKRESLVKQALAANLFYKRDRDYLVQDEKVQIIDQSTGRLMPDRSWEQGLQQMIEAKEGCLISEQREPLARISYQRFFSRYLRLGGTSGTLGEVADELHQAYDLQVRKIAANRPSKRKMSGVKIYRDIDEKKEALIKRIRELDSKGRPRPILIGTCSVEESEQTSEWLKDADIRHRVLNARQDQQEAEIIAAAGKMGAVTVATNMAGRGTDIALGTGVEALGGLHVISLNLNNSERLDRQLFGRCARQGDPGSAESILSLEDPALENCRGSTMLSLVNRLCGQGNPVSGWLCLPILRLAQRRHEAQQSKIRKALMKQDKHLRHVLAFSGRFE
ncbi:MAG: prepilin peptidase [Gammaproteobacteria bacterium]|nr:prepilin peptidase [Gammaproteobacteria bacterium]